MPIRIIENIPAEDVDTVIRANRVAGATDIKKLKEMDDEFTLIVTFPERERHATMMMRLMD